MRSVAPSPSVSCSGMRRCRPPSPARSSIWSCTDAARREAAARPRAAAGRVLGVMGLQVVRDATLIRHAYVRRAHQGEGIGGALLEALRAQSKSRLLVGTWADARWAIRFYERHGFQLVPEAEKNRLLDT